MSCQCSGRKLLRLITISLHTNWSDLLIGEKCAKKDKFCFELWHRFDKNMRFFTLIFNGWNFDLRANTFAYAHASWNDLWMWQNRNLFIFCQFTKKISLLSLHILAKEKTFFFYSLSQYEHIAEYIVLIINDIIEIRS